MTNRVTWWANEGPGALVNPWTSTKRAKGSVVVAVVLSVGFSFR